MATGFQVDETAALPVVAEAGLKIIALLGLVVGDHGHCFQLSGSVCKLALVMVGAPPAFFERSAQLGLVQLSRHF